MIDEELRFLKLFNYHTIKKDDNYWDIYDSNNKLIGYIERRIKNNNSECNLQDEYENYMYIDNDIISYSNNRVLNNCYGHPLKITFHPFIVKEKNTSIAMDLGINPYIMVNNDDVSMQINFLANTMTTHLETKYDDHKILESMKINLEKNKEYFSYQIDNLDNEKISLSIAFKRIDDGIIVTRVRMVNNKVKFKKVNHYDNTLEDAIKIFDMPHIMFDTIRNYIDNIIKSEEDVLSYLVNERKISENEIHLFMEDIPKVEDMPLRKKKVRRYYFW